MDRHDDRQIDGLGTRVNLIEGFIISEDDRQFFRRKVGS